MSPGERMVWAAVFAADWVKQSELKTTTHGNLTRIRPPKAKYSIEAAWSAVYDMRQARDGVFEEWEDDEILRMLDEMLGDGT